MAFDNIFQGPPSDVAAPGTAQSPSLGVDVVNKELYISAGEGWELIEASTVPSFAVNVMQPPYNATGDGITDDHAAIQAALNENAAIYLPVSSSGPLTFNLGTTGIQLGNNAFAYNALYGNGQILNYAGTGNAVETIANSSVYLQAVQISTNGASGSPVLFYIGGQSCLENCNDAVWSTLPNGSYTSISINWPESSVLNYIGNGAVVTASSIDEITLSGLDVDSFQIASNNTSLISCAAESANGSTSTFTGQLSLNSVTFIGPVQINGAVASLSRVNFGSTVEIGGLVSINNAVFGGQITVDNETHFSGSGNSFSGLPIIFSGFAFGSLYIFTGSGFIQYVNGLETNGFYNVSSNAIPAASTLNAGLRTFVSDATVATFGVAYTSGGSTTAPVWSDGTTWYIG